MFIGEPDVGKSVLREHIETLEKELIIRSAQGNLRLCRNLCYGSLIDAAREAQKIATIAHVNSVLAQPHWRSHEELIKQQVS